MSKYRNSLPQMNGTYFLSDSGLETTMVFHEGLELPCFAAFTLLDSEDGRERLTRYFDRHLAIALRRGMGFILDTPTWRANPDWAAKLGVSSAELDRINRDSVAFAEATRARYETEATPIVINGVFGPRGDGYRPETMMTGEEARSYHRRQMECFAEAGVDMVSAITMTHAGEAIGIAQAAQEAGLPVVVSFTVETDGRLPSGQTLAEAIAETDRETGGAPAYYMVNCAHPDHFRDRLEGGSDWMQRIRGIRANASRLSHAELDEATELDDGNPLELAADYAALRALHPQVTVFGGCCGTDHRHIEEISAAVAKAHRAAA
ncbi:homocysteine S-methyltransferase family protein [Aestuariivirga sp.]|uniref:homocysteine S-methyltransferase family protein n=1 Tax=Aestuariivirga sp. TaxID=2650926 RepID=UPI00391DBA81